MKSPRKIETRIWSDIEIDAAILKSLFKGGPLTDLRPPRTTPIDGGLIDARLDDDVAHARTLEAFLRK
jgi:hypothetical protein